MTITALPWPIIEKELIDEIILKTTNPRNRIMLELMTRGGMRIGVFPEPRQVAIKRFEVRRLETQNFPNNICYRSLSWNTLEQNAKSDDQTACHRWLPPCPGVGPQQIIEKLRKEV